MHLLDILEGLWEIVGMSSIYLRSKYLGLYVYWKALRDYGDLWVCLLAVCILNLHLSLYIYWVVLRGCGNWGGLFFGYLLSKPTFYFYCMFIGGGQWKIMEFMGCLLASCIASLHLRFQV